MVVANPRIAAVRHVALPHPKPCPKTRPAVAAASRPIDRNRAGRHARHFHRQQPARYSCRGLVINSVLMTLVMSSSPPRRRPAGSIVSFEGAFHAPRFSGALAVTHLEEGALGFPTFRPGHTSPSPSSSASSPKETLRREERSLQHLWICCVRTDPKAESKDTCTAAISRKTKRLSTVPRQASPGFERVRACATALPDSRCGAPSNRVAAVLVSR